MTTRPSQVRWTPWTQLFFSIQNLRIFPEKIFRVTFWPVEHLRFPIKRHLDWNYILHEIIQSWKIERTSLSKYNITSCHLRPWNLNEFYIVKVGLWTSQWLKKLDLISPLIKILLVIKNKSENLKTAKNGGAETLLWDRRKLTPWVDCRLLSADRRNGFDDNKSFYVRKSVFY